MNTELRLIHIITDSNKHGESAKKLSGWTWQKQQHEAMFREGYQHATETYNRNLRHGINLLKAYIKSPLLTISQKGSENMMAPT